MTFQETIIKIVDDFGTDILTSSKLVNIMNDYNAFAEDKSYRFIVKTLQSDGYLSQISSIDNWEIKSKQMVHTCVASTGLDYPH